MKILKMSILLVALVVLPAQTECKTKTAPKKKTTAQVKGSYDELVEHYEVLVKSFATLEAKRAEYEAKNPSRDEMAKLDYEIAMKREQADVLYSKMGEFPQFSTYAGKAIPASPKYMPTDKEYKECILKSKKINQNNEQEITLE